MTTRHILAILFLLLAFGLQFFFASTGIFINFILAVLVAFAFCFDFWELIIFILAAVFVINWQPALSWEIVLFALLPLAAYTARYLWRTWSAWIANLGATALAIIILYAAISPQMITGDWHGLALDLFGSLVFGQITFLALNGRGA
jgi:hypothetical protein